MSLKEPSLLGTSAPATCTPKADTLPALYHLSHVCEMKLCVWAAEYVGSFRLRLRYEYPSWSLCLSCLFVASWETAALGLGLVDGLSPFSSQFTCDWYRMPVPNHHLAPLLSLHWDSLNMLILKQWPRWTTIYGEIYREIVFVCFKLEDLVILAYFR